MKISNVTKIAMLLLSIGLVVDVTAMDRKRKPEDHTSEDASTDSSRPTKHNKATQALRDSADQRARRVTAATSAPVTPTEGKLEAPSTSSSLSSIPRVPTVQTSTPPIPVSTPVRSGIGLSPDDYESKAEAKLSETKRTAPNVDVKGLDEGDDDKEDDNDVLLAAWIEENAHAEKSRRSRLAPLNASASLRRPGALRQGSGLKASPGHPEEERSDVSRDEGQASSSSSSSSYREEKEDEEDDKAHAPTGLMVDFVASNGAIVKIPLAHLQEAKVLASFKSFHTSGTATKSELVQDTGKAQELIKRALSDLVGINWSYKVLSGLKLVLKRLNKHHLSTFHPRERSYKAAIMVKHLSFEELQQLFFLGSVLQIASVKLVSLITVIEYYQENVLAFIANTEAKTELFKDEFYVMLKRELDYRKKDFTGSFLEHGEHLIVHGFLPTWNWHENVTVKKEITQRDEHGEDQKVTIHEIVPLSEAFKIAPATTLCNLFAATPLFTEYIKQLPNLDCQKDLIIRLIQTKVQTPGFDFLEWFVQLPQGDYADTKSPRRIVADDIQKQADAWLEEIGTKEMVKEAFGKLSEGIFKVYVRKQYRIKSEEKQPENIDDLDIDDLDIKTIITSIDEATNNSLDLRDFDLTTFDGFLDLCIIRHGEAWLHLLNVMGNSLTSLPAGIRYLSQLEILYANHNNLTHLPPEILGLTQLKKLEVAYNELTSLTGIGYLTRLQGLNVAGNKLTNLDEINELTQLTKLYVYDNPQLKAKRIASIKRYGLSIDDEDPYAYDHDEEGDDEGDDTEEDGAEEGDDEEGDEAMEHEG